MAMVLVVLGILWIAVLRAVVELREMMGVPSPDVVVVVDPRGVIRMFTVPWRCKRSARG